MENNSLVNFEMPRENNSIIKVLGVGGGGCNAVDHMFRLGIHGVDFIVCNTDQQALDRSPVTYKIALGKNLTEGLGAGSIPERGRDAAIESIDEIRDILSRRTKMVFITAGMGGGTGTGAAPVIASVARELGIVTVGIVTVPFAFEGPKRKKQAKAGIEEMRKHVDTLLIISNDKLRMIYGNLRTTEAFGKADDIVATAAKGIADIITTTLHINTDFADIETVLKNSGVAIMGSGSASGENRARKAVEMALSSPLLSESNIRGARHVLLNITCGVGEHEITMDEFGEITDFLAEVAGTDAEVIQGYGNDESLGDLIRVTVVATGFINSEDAGLEMVQQQPEKKIHTLDTSSHAPQVPPVSIQPEPLQPDTPAERASTFNAVSDTELRIVHALDSSIPPVKDTISHPDEGLPFFQPTGIDYDPIVSQVNKQEEPAHSLEPVLKTTQPSEPELFSAEETASRPAAQTQKPLQEEDEHQRKAKERMERLKNFNFRKSLNELERQPAYERKQVRLEQVPPSDQSSVSRYTLGEGDSAELRNNNSFLHDSVD